MMRHRPIAPLLGLVLLHVAPTGVSANPVVIGNARFSVLADECIRLEYSPNGRFTDLPSQFAIRRKHESANFTLRRDRGRIVIETPRIHLYYRPDGKPFHAGNVRATIRGAISSWKPGATPRQNLGGTLSTLDGLTGPADLGNGLLARDGWYLLDDSQSLLLNAGWVEPRPGTGGQDWYLFGYGHDYKAALRAFMRVGGEVPLPRRYTMGSWYSRWWPYTSQDYRKIVEEYEAHDFPLDIIVMDMDWHRDGWTGWSWNRKLLPDAEQLLKWYHEHGVRVTLNVHPADGVAPHEDRYADFMRGLGLNPLPPRTVPFDAGNQRYMQTLFSTLHKPLEDEGVDFWWLDWQQERFTPSLPTLSNLWWLNHLYQAHTGEEGRRGQGFSRWAGWGDHRTAVHFSGDANTGWKMLAFEVPFTAVAGNVGCFFWSHDLGGFWGERIEEAIVRWVQFGATTAAMRLHSSRDASLDKRPWTYSSLATDAMRVAFHLRSELMPYIYTSAWEGHARALPLTRPMYLEYPEAPEAYQAGQEYFLGDALLAAPITQAGTGKTKIARQTVWFPPGRWYDWFTSARYDGDSTRPVEADLLAFPLFARGGVPIPMQPYTSRMTLNTPPHLVVRVYPGESGKSSSFTLYEDDGISDRYLDGQYSLNRLTYARRGDRVQVRIGGAKGDYEGMPDERSYEVDFAATDRAAFVWVDGKPARFQYDPATRVNRVPIAASDTRRPHFVNVVFPRSSD